MEKTVSIRSTDITFSVGAKPSFVAIADRDTVSATQIWDLGGTYDVSSDATQLTPPHRSTRIRLHAATSIQRRRRHPLHVRLDEKVDAKQYTGMVQADKGI